MRHLGEIIAAQIRRPDTLFKHIVPYIGGRCPLCQDLCLAGSFCSACISDILEATASHQHRCNRCQLALDGLGYCESCYLSKPHYERLSIGFDYVMPLKSLVLRFKNSSQLSLAKPFARLLQARLQQQRLNIPAGRLCIPLPASHQSLKKRGYNPASEIAKELAKLNGWRISHDALRRDQTRLYTEQKSLDSLERRLNVRDLYYCSYRLEEDEVILIDDVLTSGATIDSACQALKAAGVKRIHVIVLARAQLLTH
ncbi:MAG: ComF family protein [Alcaligenaceae bacterium]|nr:ComF family protein [Alcaligenaceae bacterium]